MRVTGRHRHTFREHASPFTFSRSVALGDGISIDLSDGRALARDPEAGRA
jgi:hypothetical protein